MSQTSNSLRRLLAEKFPSSRIGLNPQWGEAKDFWPVNFTPVIAAPPLQLAKGAITEIICDENHSGSAGLIQAIIRQAARENHIIGMVDGMDSLDVISLPTQAQSRLLWIRCRSVSMALKSAELLLRDSNFSFVLVDLKLNLESELQKIPAVTWHRLQRLIENTSTICAVFTPRLLVSTTRRRLNVPVGENPFSKL